MRRKIVKPESKAPTKSQKRLILASNLVSALLLLALTSLWAAQLALDGTEFTCLKALVLFNPHVAGLSGGEQVGVASADLWSPVP